VTTGDVVAKREDQRRVILRHVAPPDGEESTNGG
jgi:hypothetical protein